MFLKQNKFLNFIKRPHGLLLSLVYFLTAGAIAGAILVAVMGESQSVYAYILYGLSALFLGYTVYTIIIYAPVLKQRIKDGLMRHRLTARILEQYDFKTTVFAAISLIISVGFAVMNLVSAILYRNLWYGALAGYYAVLIIFRGFVIFFALRAKKKYGADDERYNTSRWKIHLASGAILILLEIAMAAAVTQMVLSSRPTESGEIMAISNAAYTFYKMVTAIVNLVRARKHDDPVTQSLRNLNFADACMSMVSLTVLMIATFDTSDTQTTEMLFVKATVGFAACVIIIVLASVMIIKSNKALKTVTSKNRPEEGSGFPDDINSDET